MSSQNSFIGRPNPNVLDALGKLAKKINLSRSEMQALMKKIMLGQLSAVQVAAIIVALRVKGEVVEEILGAVEIMRELVTKVDLGNEKVVDLCGTGGDGASTFNISTAAMFVVAGAGMKVAKHGGRAVSSNAGSADLLEAFGANINLTPDQVRGCIEATNIGFMFAPNYHPAMRHVAPIRRDLGIRTIFNILGPLTNPAKAKRQLIGVFHKNLLRPLAEVLKILGSKHVLLVHGENGLDEISLHGTTLYAELREGKIIEGSLTPENFGISKCEHTDVFQSIKIENVEESKSMIYESLSPSKSNAKNIVALNAAAALYVGGAASTLKVGFAKSIEAINSGAARETLDNFVQYTSMIREN